MYIHKRQVNRIKFNSMHISHGLVLKSLEPSVLKKFSRIGEEKRQRRKRRDKKSRGPKKNNVENKVRQEKEKNERARKCRGITEGGICRGK